ncbi:hypothetical protein ACFL2V_05755 [Pseudomonadota bacterium]
MESYSDWLKSKVNSNRSYKDLIEIYSSNPSKWDKTEDVIDKLRLLVFDFLQDQAQKSQQQSGEHSTPSALSTIEDNVIDVLNSSWIDWREANVAQSVPPNENGAGSISNSKFATILLLIGAGALSVFMVIIIYKIFSIKSGVLESLSNTDSARGLITSLFALGTIILSLILVLSSILSRPGSDREFNYRKERFNQGKEVLGLLLGILGTIVGFYFGTAGNDVPVPQPTISQIEISGPKQDGGEYMIAANTIDGEPPYLYQLSFPGDSGIKDISDIKSDAGLLLQKFSLPTTAKDKEIKLTLIVTDGKGHVATQQAVVPQVKKAE